MTGLYSDFYIRLGIDLVCVIVLIRLIYYRAYRRADLFLTFFSFNIIIFFIAFLLNRVEMTLGAAFGLFAVFSMLRYRTEGISTTDMTYLFMVIALGLLMAISENGPAHLALIGATILLCTQLLESGWLGKRERKIQVVHRGVGLVHARARAELLEELRERTGLNIHRVDIREIDYRRDVARLTLYFHPHDEHPRHENSKHPRAGGGAPSGVRFNGSVPDEPL